jgi:uncharacterized protein DUF4339
MAVGWHLFDGVRQLGPFPLNELKRLLEGQNSSAVRVWREGLDGWVVPDDLPEFASPQPPPLPAISKIEHDHRVAAMGAAKPSRFNNFVAMNWRGEFSLGTTYWIFGFLGNLVAGIFAVVVAGVFQADGSFEPKSIFATMLAVWVVIGAIAIWQSVGVWRSANRHIKARVLLGKTSPWAGLAKVAVFVGVLRLAGTFLSSGWPQLFEAGRMSFLGDPDIPAYSIRVMHGGTEAEITGGFKYGLTDDFVKILGASRQIKVVHLDSLGGRIGEATKLNNVIRSGGLDTYVSSKCMSACTIAFAAGAHRILRRGAVLGFHAPSFPGMTKEELVEASRDQKAVFLTAGFDRKFVDQALSTPNTDIWKPGSGALLQAKVVTAISDGSDFSMSGMGASPTKNDFAVMLSKAIPLMGPLKTRFPDDYGPIVQGYYENFESGKTEAQSLAEVRERLLAILQKLRPLADDSVLSDIGAVYADQYNALGSKNPTLCYRYAAGVGPAIAPSEIPDDLIAKENDVNRRVVETATMHAGDNATASGVIWKKIGTALGSKGVKSDQFDLLSAAIVPPEKYSDYCTVATMLFREVSELPRNEAGIIMRDILAAK